MLRKIEISDECHRSFEHLISKNNRPPYVSKVKANVKSKWGNLFLGAFYTLFCSITILLSNVIVKKLTYIDAGQLSFIRNLGVLFCSLPVAIYSTENIFGPKEYVWLLVTREVLGSLSLYLNMLSYRFLPLTETSIIMSTVPALVTIVARIHLKEPCGFTQMVSIILIFLGVLVSIRLPEVLQNSASINFDGHYAFGLSCAVGCVLIITIIMIAIRKMRSLHFSIMLIYFGRIGAVENAVITYFTANFELPYCEGPVKMEVMLIGILVFISHCFLTLALQKEAAGVVSTLKAAFDIVLSTIFDFIFFDSIPDYYTLGSSLLVTVTISTLGVYKWLQT